MTALDDGDNGRHFCTEKARIDSLEEGIGRCVAESSGAHNAAKRCFDEVVSLRGELKLDRESRQRECDLRHRAGDIEARDIKQRVGRLEDHEDDEPDTGIMSRDELVTDRHRLKDTHETELRRERIKAIVAVVAAVCGALTALGTVLLSR